MADDYYRFIETAHMLRGVQMNEGCVVPRDALFVPPRFVPNNQLLVDLGCAIDDDWVTTDGTDTIPEGSTT